MGTHSGNTLWEQSRKGVEEVSIHRPFQKISTLAKIFTPDINLTEINLPLYFPEIK